MNLSEFQETYPDFSFLEETKNATRFSNGLAPDTDNESIWFCKKCEQEVSLAELEFGCDCDEESE